MKCVHFFLCVLISHWDISCIYDGCLFEVMIIDIFVLNSLCIVLENNSFSITMLIGKRIRFLNVIVVFCLLLCFIWVVFYYCSFSFILHLLQFWYSAFRV